MRLFLAAALLGVGTTSAWAADKTVVKYSFDDAMSPRGSAPCEFFLFFVLSSPST